MRMVLVSARWVAALTLFSALGTNGNLPSGGLSEMDVYSDETLNNLFDSLPAELQTSLRAALEDSGGNIDADKITELITATYGGGASQTYAGVNLTAIQSALDGEDVSALFPDADYEDPLDVVQNSALLPVWVIGQEFSSFISDIGRPGARMTKDVHINWVKITGDGTKGAIVFSPEAGIPVTAYDELFWDLTQAGYSPIYAIDHRGQGYSDRLIDVIQGNFLNYVEDIGDVVTDFRKFVATVKEDLDGLDKSMFLLCDGFGCGVSTIYAVQEYEYQRPQLFQAAAASAPMLESTGGSTNAQLPQWIHEGVSRFLVGTPGFARLPDPLTTPWDPNSITSESLQLRRPTRSLTRWQRYLAMCYSLFNTEIGNDNHQGVCALGKTIRFSKEEFDIWQTQLRPFMATAGKILSVPMLMLQAGSPTGNDTIVQNTNMGKFCDTSLSDCTVVSYPESKHQILLEMTATRTAAIQAIDDFFIDKNDTLVANSTFTGQNPLPAGLKYDGEECAQDAECATRHCDARARYDYLGGSCRDIITNLSASAACFNDDECASNWCDTRYAFDIFDGRCNDVANNEDGEYCNSDKECANGQCRATVGFSVIYGECRDDIGNQTDGSGCYKDLECASTWCDVSKSLGLFIGKCRRAGINLTVDEACRDDRECQSTWCDFKLNSAILGGKCQVPATLANDEKCTHDRECVTGNCKSSLGFDVWGGKCAPQSDDVVDNVNVKAMFVSGVPVQAFSAPWLIALAVLVGHLQ